MAVDSRVQELLGELGDSGCTLDEICPACPGLLPEVRRRWLRMCTVEAELHALFPTPARAPKPPFRGIRAMSCRKYRAMSWTRGMGLVYKARQSRLDRPVAVKMLLVGAHATRAECQRFAREADLVAERRHPSLVQFYDFSDDEGTSPSVRPGSRAPSSARVDGPTMSGMCLLVANVPGASPPWRASC
jgi:serine/threonine-protein kinase